MFAPLVPWENGNIPEEIQAELNRRRVNRNFNYIAATQGGWDNNSTNIADWQKYRGPMIPWIRFCSNGAGRPAENILLGPNPPKERFDKQGFVFFGGKDFYTSYGFINPSKNISGNTSIIGYMPNGAPHIIENDPQTSNYPINVPPPEIERVSITLQKELYRRASIEWVCFSPKQLEYMTPYFLVPGISCILEWGWNHFDATSLLNLDDTDELIRLRKNPYPLYTQHILGSKGNYDVLFGVITHFEWSIDGIKIRCKTEITSPDRIYAGLMLDSSVILKSEDKQTNEKSISILNSLKQFVVKELPEIKSVATAQNPTSLPGEIGAFINHIYEYPKAKADEIVYGIFYGRDLNGSLPATSQQIENFTGTMRASSGQYMPIYFPNNLSSEKKVYDQLKFKNKDKDFDMKDQKNVWINMAMVMEIFNFHSKQLQGYGNQPMFKIDIDDCVISGHPNLISTDGTALLVPNASSPKYFYGQYGYVATKDPGYWGQTFARLTDLSDLKNFFSTTGYTPNTDEYNKTMRNADYIESIVVGNIDKKKLEKDGWLPDYHLYRVCLQQGGSYRDDHDKVINALRYQKLENPRSFSFPFETVIQPSGIPNAREYPIFYSGYLKDLYVSVKRLQEILNRDSIKTFTEAIGAILTEISNAAGNMWDLRLVDSTGRYGLDDSTPVTMKIVDYKFVGSINTGKVYTFDYFDAESLLQSIRFTPTISNPQAIRTMFAETNNPQNRAILSDQNELLDYHFKDRLRLDDPTTPLKNSSAINSFRPTIAKLQLLDPPEDAMQMTLPYDKGGVIIKRLVLPSPEILKILLDDDDKEHNPRYTGIMPGIQAEFTIQGIGGLRTFMMFLVRNLPEPYSHTNIVFRIVNLTENIEAGKWTTTITAGILPLRKYVKERLGIDTIS